MEKIFYSREYLDSIATWQLIDDFVDGTTSRVTHYVQRYASENPNDSLANSIFRARLARIENENELDPIKQVLLFHLDQPLNFHALSDDPKMKQIIDDATGFDESAQDVFHALLSAFIDHGRVGLLIDSDAAVAESLAEATLNGERSYQIVYNATEIVHWSVFTRGPNRGKLRSVILKDQNITYQNTERVSYIRFQLAENVVTRDLLIGPEPKDVRPVDGIDVEVIETRTVALSEIPFIIFGKGLKDSSMRLPAQYSKKLLNDRSVRDNTDYCQNFQRTIITGAKTDEIKVLSENVIACIENPDASVNTIEPGTADGLRRTIAGLETKCRRQGMRQLNQIVADDSKEAPSAESKAMDLKALNAYFQSTITMFERKIRRVFQFHAEYEQYKPEVTITIGRSFGLESVNDIRTERAMIFSQAGTLGALEVQKQVLLQSVSEMKGVVADDGDIDGSATRERLMNEVRNAQGPQPEPYSPFGNV